MMRLSEEQEKIIKSKSKHLLVIAGAGTGKTTVLTAKIKHLLKDNVKASEILAITFTKKAANEMKERIKNNDVLIYTFDALCYNLIKENNNINIIKDNIPFYQKDVLSFHLYDANLKVDKKPTKYDQYVKYKLNNNLKDFNDIEYLALKHLENQPLKVKYILVDEFQDTNRLQLAILHKIISEDSYVFVVGDPDQSIYGFRGAYKNIFSDYVKKYNPEVLKLTNNYRSTKNIIKVANNLISYNSKRLKKSLISFKDEYGKVKYFNFTNIEQEVELIIKLFDKLNQAERKSFAILYRNHNQAYELKHQLLQKNYDITTLSIHEAKGLEFDIVFLIGVNKGVFPSNNTNTQLVLEEERRLMFVAITRSKSVLYISSIKNPSLFIKEIGLKHLP